MRFLVDENLPAGIAGDLVSRGFEVLDLAVSGARGASDLEVWRRAREEDRVLVSKDLDFPIPGALGRPPGLVLVRPRSIARGREIERLFAEAMTRVDPSTLLGAVTVIEPGRVRQRRYSDLDW